MLRQLDLQLLERFWVGHAFQLPRGLNGAGNAERGALVRVFLNAQNHVMRHVDNYGLKYAVIVHVDGRVNFPQLHLARGLHIGNLAAGVVTGWRGQVCRIVAVIFILKIEVGIIARKLFLNLGVAALAVKTCVLTLAYVLKPFADAVGHNAALIQLVTVGRVEEGFRVNGKDAGADERRHLLCRLHATQPHQHRLGLRVACLVKHGQARHGVGDGLLAHDFLVLGKLPACGKQLLGIGLCQTVELLRFLAVLFVPEHFQHAVVIL